MTPIEQLQQNIERERARQAAEASAPEAERFVGPTEKLARGFNTALINAANTATAGAAVPLAGLARWAASPITGEDLTLGEQIAGRRQALRNMNNEAGSGTIMAGDVAGAFLPGGAPAALGRAGMKAAGKLFTEGAERALPRMAGQAGAAAVETGLYNANTGRTNMSDLATSEGRAAFGTDMLISALGAGGIQGLTDGGAAFSKWLFGGRNAANIEEALATARGSAQGGVSPKELVETRMADGQGYLDALERSPDPVSVAQKTAPYIVSTPVPDNPGPMLDDALTTTQAYKRRVEDQVIDTVNAAATMQTPAQRLARLDDSLAPTREQYNLMLKADGSRLVDPKKVKSALRASFGIRPDAKDALRNLSEADKKAFRRINRELTAALGQDNRLRMKQLVTLKKTVDEMFNPLMRSGTDKPLSREATRSLMAFKKKLVNLIDANTSTNYKKLNQQFAEQFRVEEAFNAGQSAFGNKMTLGEVEDWLDAVDNDAIREGFREGFSDAFATSVQQKGYMGALRNLLGTADDSLRVKVGNVDKLEKVLGPEITSALKEVATVTGPRAQAADIIEKALRIKVNNPNNVDANILQDFALAGAGFGSRASQAVGISALGRIRTKPTARTGEDMLGILGSTGMKYNQLTEDWYDTLMGDYRATTGAPLVAASHSVEDDEARPRTMMLDLVQRPQ